MSDQLEQNVSEPADATKPAETPSETTDKSTAGSAQVTAEAIAEAMKKAGLAKTERQYTQEDFDRAFRVFKADRKHLEALRRAISDDSYADEGVATLQEIAQGIYTQAATMAAYLAQRLKEEELGPRLAAVEQWMHENRVNKLREQFYSQYEDLKPYEAIVDSVADKLIATGFSGSVEEGFKLVADKARSLIKTLLSGSGKGGERSNAPTSKMSTLLGGGQGGAATSDLGKGKMPPGLEVFE